MRVWGHDGSVGSVTKILYGDGVGFGCSLGLCPRDGGFFYAGKVQLMLYSLTVPARAAAVAAGSIGRKHEGALSVGGFFLCNMFPPDRLFVGSYELALKRVGRCRSANLLLRNGSNCSWCSFPNKSKECNEGGSWRCQRENTSWSSIGLFDEFLLWQTHCFFRAGRTGWKVFWLERAAKGFKYLLQRGDLESLK